MTLKLRLKNTSALAVSRLKAEFARIRERLRTQQGSNLISVLRDLFTTTASVLTKIGKPSFDPKYLQYDADPDPAAWNQNMEQIETDLTTLFEENTAIGELQAEASNAAAILAKELEERANYAQSMITDLRLTVGQLDQEVLVAGDDFTDLSKIDQAFPLTYTRADVNTLQGIVTLHRIEAVNVVEEGAKISVTPLAPTEALNRLPKTPDNTKRFYEGKFYAPIAEARPEGGKWHLEERVKPGTVVPEASAIFDLDIDADSVADGSVFDGFPDLEAAAADRPQALPLNPEDILVIDRGALLDELNRTRSRMIDGSPDTFWECEFVLHAPQLDALAETLVGQEGVDSTTTPENPQLSEVTPDELRGRAAQSDIDLTDLEVELVFELPSRQMINFIAINPMNFGETAWIEVTDVSTARDEEDGFLQIEGFGNQVFDNILTNEANEELTDEEAKTSLAPNRYSYRGQAVYTFPPRDVLRVRIRLKQRTPVPTPYERLAVQLNRTLTASSTKVKADAGGII